MYTEKFPNLTPSRAPALLCLKRFHAEHVARLVPQPAFAPAMAYGIVVHETLRDIFNPNNPLPPAKRDVHAYARRAVTRRNYPDADLREADLEKCIASVTAYVRQCPESDETIGAEVFDTLHITSRTRHPLALGTKFDRLFVGSNMPHHLRICDYKTGTPGAADLDGAVIMLAIAAMKFKEYDGYSVEYDYLDTTGLKERRVVSFAEAKSAWPDLKQRALRVYTAEEFPAEPGEHCLFCPLRPTCQPELTTTLEELDNMLS